MNINSIDRPEGFKEKRAELTASKIYPVTSEAMIIDENQRATNRASNRSITQQQPQEENYSNVVDLKSRRSSTFNQESTANLPEDELPNDDSDPIPF